MAGTTKDRQELNLFDPREKIALFIDGANLYATSKSLGFDIDYKKLLQEFQSKGYLIRAYYYTALAEDQEYSSIRPLIDWLDYNGYTVVTKPTKEFVDATGRRKIKGNMDIELAVDVMELAATIDHIVLFSGDGDFRSLVEAVQRRGRKVTVISTLARPVSSSVFSIVVTPSTKSTKRTKPATSDTIGWLCGSQVATIWPALVAEPSLRLMTAPYGNL